MKPTVTIWFLWPSQTALGALAPSWQTVCYAKETSVENQRTGLHRKKKERKNEYRDDGVGAGIDHPQHLVPGGSGQKGAVKVPGEGGDKAVVGREGRCLSCAVLNIPDLDELVHSRGQQQILGEWMPADVLKPLVVRVLHHMGGLGVLQTTENGQGQKREKNTEGPLTCCTPSSPNFHKVTSCSPEMAITLSGTREEVRNNHESEIKKQEKKK